MTAAATPRVRRADLLTETWNGLTDRLAQLYAARSGVAGDRDIEVVPISNTDDLERRLQDQSRPLQLPVIGVSIGAIEPDTASYNASVMRRYGARSMISEDRSTWTVLSVVPVMSTFSVRLRTDDILTMIRMVDRWMANEIWGFRLEQADLRIEIQVLADKALSIPAAASGPGQTSQFNLDTTLRVRTYSGYVVQVPSVYAVELGLNVADASASLAALAAAPSEPFTITRTFYPSTHAPEA